MPQSPSDKILNQLVSAAPDLTFALNNFTFDFTLWKSTPPLEYSGLGNALSRKRKAAAEDGEEHVIARKLSGLFQNFVPEVPSLISAYGQRVSKIASAYPDKARASYAPGIFAEYAGFDGTSIWAAATSSKEGICLHLLACMLARLWDGPEAISIWWEVVQQRKADLAKVDPEDPLHLMLVGASRIELSREELAQWDASARSWLDIADQVMKKEQTRLFLLVDKTKLPIDVRPGVYKSVTSAWRKALTTIDKIIEGMSYAVEDGAVVLGLASWHLFPKMYVLRPDSNKDVEQNDAVIPKAGIVTFGLEGLSCDQQDEAADGIRWSLPLAHLRFYGDPVLSKTSLGTSSLRLQVSEFSLIVLGSFLSRWGPRPLDVVSASSLLLAMWEFLSTTTATNLISCPLPNSDGVEKALPHPEIVKFPGCNSWFKLLADAASDLLSSEGEEREVKECLVDRGHRRHEDFLAPVCNNPQPVLGLHTLKGLLQILHEEGVIRVLRSHIKLSGYDPADLIIRYRHRHRPYRRFSKKAANFVSTTQAAAPDFSPRGELTYSLSDGEKSTDSGLDAEELFPDITTSKSVLEDDSELTNVVDSLSDAEELFTATNSSKRALEDDFEPTNAKRKKPATEAGLPAVGDFADSVVNAFKKDEVTNFKFDDIAECYELASALPDPEPQNEHGFYGHTRWLESSLDQKLRSDELTARGENVKYFDQEQMSEWDETTFSWQGREESLVKDEYVFLFGDPSIGAVYCKPPSTNMPEQELSLDEVRHAFEAHAIHPEKFLQHLTALEQSEGEGDVQVLSQLVVSLKGIASVSALYKLMPNATIAANTFDEPFHEAEWLDDPNVIGEAEVHRSSLPRILRPTTAGLWTSEGQQDYQDDHFMNHLRAYKLNRPQAFSCIARLEKVSCNMRPEGLSEVMALSVANSIYVAMPLLCDPFEEPSEFEIKHVIGNIGRPGLSFLVPPPNPKVKKQPDLSLVRHRSFDGTLGVDKYSSTSMHLSFTRSKVPISLSHSGAQDVEAYFRQAVVSLHGNDGQWVADLDILNALDSGLFRRMKDPSRFPCSHTLERRTDPTCLLKAIDNWDEYLDRPKVPGVVRASGNWLARLAAATLNVQRGFPVLVLPQNGDSDTSQKVCWACAVAQGWKAKEDANAYNAADLPFFIA